MSRVYRDERRRAVRATPGDLWRVLEGIGGQAGWYSVPYVWTVRALADRVVGGVGLRRGRSDPRHLAVGDQVDWWRVERVVPDELLRLRAEVKVPGTAWLELRVERGEAGTAYVQRVLFAPRGLAGRAYWLVVAPFHGVVFGTMVRRIVRAAEQRAGSPERR